MENDIFEKFLESAGIIKAGFRGRNVYKFETNNLPAMMARLTDCHDKLYRTILTIHLSMLPEKEKAEQIKDFRSFVNRYLDRATNEICEAEKSGELISSSFAVVK